MKIVGLIAEYNPFHNGHLYHIAKAKELTHADHVIVIMSGDYVQRGLPSIMPKRLRARMALEGGASAVFELPVCYATGSAELFAEGAVAFLDKLGIVDSICFGSECNDLAAMDRIAEILVQEPDLYRTYLQTHLKMGASFPQARQTAIELYLQDSKASFPLKDPNNILGIEYLKALKRRNSSIIPYTIQREGAHYHDERLHATHSSASAIRTLFSDRTTAARQSIFNELKTQVPTSCHALLTKSYQTHYPVDVDDFSLLLKYRLLDQTPALLTQYMDVSDELANRICGQRTQYIKYKQFSESLKTREVTQTRINRALLHILLGTKKSDVAQYRENDYHFYAHLLGFRKNCAEVLSAIAKNSHIPLLTKLYDQDALSSLGKRMLTQDILSSNLYTSVITDKFETPFQEELIQPILKI